MTSLVHAVTTNSIATVRDLIRQGAEVNDLDQTGTALLITAAYRGYTEIVQLLLEAGADITVVDPSMRATALHAAAYAGRTDAARILIDHHIDIDAQGPSNGYTALHDAIWQDNQAIARLLIDAGANLERRSNAGETPLMFARTHKRHAIVTMIEDAQTTARTHP